MECQEQAFQVEQFQEVVSTFSSLRHLHLDYSIILSFRNIFNFIQNNFLAGTSTIVNTRPNLNYQF